MLTTDDGARGALGEIDMPQAPDRTSAGSRRVCDVCEAYSSAERGSLCKTCAVGTMRYLSELQVIRSERQRARRAARRASSMVS